MIKLSLTGPLSIIVAYIGGTIMDIPLNLISTPESYLNIALSSFLSIAVMEEGAKLLFLKLLTWKHSSFTQRYDGVLFSAFVSLSFSAFENIIYVVSDGLSIIPLRALISTPVHLFYAMFMGIYYSKAKRCEIVGDKVGIIRNLFLGWFYATILHGLYDTLGLMGTVPTFLLFVVFVVVMYIWLYKMIKREINTKEPLYEMEEMSEWESEE